MSSKTSPVRTVHFVDPFNAATVAEKSMPEPIDFSSWSLQEDETGTTFFVGFWKEAYPNYAFWQDLSEKGPEPNWYAHPLTQEDTKTARAVHGALREAEVWNQCLHAELFGVQATYWGDSWGMSTRHACWKRMDFTKANQVALSEALLRMEYNSSKTPNLNEFADALNSLEDRIVPTPVAAGVALALVRVLSVIVGTPHIEDAKLNQADVIDVLSCYSTVDINGAYDFAPERCPGCFYLRHNGLNLP